jgi:predicted dinucleotide-binding enzyme
MRIGFIGAGNVTRTFGRHLINAGHTIVVSNSRGPDTLAELATPAIPGLWCAKIPSGSHLTEMLALIVSASLR